MVFFGLSHKVNKATFMCSSVAAAMKDNTKTTTGAEGTSVALKYRNVEA